MILVETISVDPIEIFYKLILTLVYLKLKLASIIPLEAYIQKRFLSVQQESVQQENRVSVTQGRCMSYICGC